LAAKFKGKDTIFKFRKHDNIGAIDAHDDSEFLKTCFVDNPGILECLRDTQKNERIILGRTGAGKTALIERLKAEEGRVGIVEPENLSLQFLSNSPILKYLEEQQIHLDLFYKLLWKHVFLIELLNLKFSYNSSTLKDWWDKFFATKIEKTALQYSKEWSGSFFLVMEKRVVEIESRLTTQIASEMGISNERIRAMLSGKEEVSEGERSTLHQKAQEVVNKIQIEQLNKIIDGVAKEAFAKSEPKFFLVIDKLDENWVDSKVRYQLIRALMDTMREFSNKFKSVKICLALREDLLHSVFKNVRKEGLQEQKYKSFYLRLKWTQKDLMQILDRRLQRLAIDKGFDPNFPVRKLYPDAIGAEAFAIYFTKRTLFAPRDVVEFFNTCIEHADGKEKIGINIVRVAEGHYSKARLDALYEEWASVYPNLKICTQLLKSKARSFLVADLDRCVMEDIILSIDKDAAADELSIAIEQHFNGKLSEEDLKCAIALIFYKTGLIGLKMEAYEGTSWSFTSSAYIGFTDIKSSTRVEICPAFYRSLGIDPGTAA
jgi:hypothetical protein